MKPTTTPSISGDQHRLLSGGVPKGLLPDLTPFPDRHRLDNVFGVVGLVPDLPGAHVDPRDRLHIGGWAGLMISSTRQGDHESRLDRAAMAAPAGDPLPRPTDAHPRADRAPTPPRRDPASGFLHNGAASHPTPISRHASDGLGGAWPSLRAVCGQPASTPGETKRK
jgi:hypothetical protein